MPAFLPWLLTGLRNYEEYEVCSIAVGVVGDICRGLEKAITPYCEDIMNLLMQDLQVGAFRFLCLDPYECV